MAKKTTLRSAKRFGVRYGKRNKEKVATLEREHRGKRKCPYCNYIKLKRLSKGIWLCEKCNVKFASKAYTIATPKRRAAEPVKAPIEEPEEPIEEILKEEDLEEEEPTEPEQADEQAEEKKPAEEGVA
jgi:ribosomal protein eL43